MILTIDRKQEVIMPTIPNYIKVGETVVSVAALTDQQLRDIGATWTLLLVERARIIRERNKTEIGLTK